jgi:MarR family transcriptional regulator, organic hydroperoxide resistance regulator
MTKAPFDDADVASDIGALAGASRDKRTPQVFDDRGRTVAWMARTVHRLYNAQAQTILDEEKVTIAHWFYLRVLAQHGELNQLELSKRVGMASATAVPALDNMEKRGLLKRRRDPKDRRKYYVGLTDKGRRLVDRLLPKIGAMIFETLDGITYEEMHIFWKVAHHIAKNLAAMAKDESVLD